LAYYTRTRQLAPAVILLQNGVFPGYRREKMMIGYVTLGTKKMITSPMGRGIGRRRRP
jgi:hypothetical protein